MFKWAFTLLLLLLPVSGQAQQCIPQEIFETFIKEKFGMKLKSWAVDKNGTETIWLYMNELNHFALIRVDLGGCSAVEMPEEQLSFFKQNPSYFYDPNNQEFMSRGKRM